jgi:hypothetical protein
MNLTLKLELHTEKRNGGNGGVFLMFYKGLVITQLTGAQLISWIEHGYIQLNDYTFRPMNLKVVDNEQCVCIAEASAPLFRKQDSIEYYETLQREGWVAHIKDTEKIQHAGYINFKPERFILG